jgi:arginyl-tRNA synthetase
MEYIRQRNKKEIIAVLNNALDAAIRKGELQVEEKPPVMLEIPREKSHGDYASNLAMQLPKAAKKAPRVIAEILVANINTEGTNIDSVEIAGPGFLNFRLKQEWVYEALREVETMGNSYGRSEINTGKSINVEFISANPTGPMHMGNARGGAIGDTLAALFDWTGYDVVREFYINDAGNQIEKFGDSLNARFLQLTGEDIVFPEDGYQGEDITQHMREFIEEKGTGYKNIPEETRKGIFIEYALEKNLKKMKEDLDAYGIHYDLWFSERTLHESGKIDEIIAMLKEKGLAYDEEGATWFRSTEFGCDKDDVLIRKNGLPTYFAADIAYHLDKFNRGFSRCINVWGADHHGHVARLQGAMNAVNGRGDDLEIVIMQLVRLMRNGEVARMSKRTGKMITLIDLIEDIGIDAARFFFNYRSPDSHLEFDLDLAVEQSNENPVFYVQYAHARICSILRQLDNKKNSNSVDYTVLKEKEEIALLEKLSDFPMEIISGAQKMDPSTITKYSIDLAAAFHTFYNACRVRVEDVKIMNARAALIKATQQVIKNALDILGISAPEQM